MVFLRVDQTLCSKCGLCSSVCPRGLIRIDRHWPEAEDSSLCIACGHCVAVCPSAALENSKAPLSKQLPLPSYPTFGKEKTQHFLRSRRSIRSYQSKPVPRHELSELIDIARYAPSGGNSQGISYLVIDLPEILHRITEYTVTWMESPSQNKSPSARIYAQYAAMYRQYGHDSILRNAPALILGTAVNGFARGRENTLLSLEYVELYAPVIGLGTCWAGILEAAAFSGFPPLLEVLKIPEGKDLTGALMVGYPDVVFQRLVERNPLDITFMET